MYTNTATCRGQYHAARAAAAAAPTPVSGDRPEAASTAAGAAGKIKTNIFFYFKFFNQYVQCNAFFNCKYIPRIGANVNTIGQYSTRRMLSLCVHYSRLRPSKP